MNHNYTLKPLFLLSVLAFACTPQKNEKETDNTAAVRASLSKALTFHASFDNGADADFGSGDKTLYSIDEEKSGEITEGLGDPPLSIVAGKGKYSDAIEFTLENSHVVFYKVEKNIAYSPDAFKGTVSFWMNVDPNEIPGQYCDPIQITDKDYSDDAIWVDITKNDTPPDLRLGFFGNQPVWDVNNQKGRSEEFFWRLHKVAEPPLAKGLWTHVVVTWDGVNNSDKGRARLYLNGEFEGASSAIREPFTWDVANTHMRFGTGHYVGMFDDVAVFNESLSAEEVHVLYTLDQGVAELYK